MLPSGKEEELKKPTILCGNREKTGGKERDLSSGECRDVAHESEGRAKLKQVLSSSGGKGGEEKNRERPLSVPARRKTHRAGCPAFERRGGVRGARQGKKKPR